FVVLTWQPQAHALDAAVEVVEHLHGRAVGGRRVERVEPAHHREHHRGVVDASSERTYLVEARREGDQPVATDAPIGRLHAHDAAQRGGAGGRTPPVRGPT